MSAAQGYVTMAYGAPKYFEMAGNLALSVRYSDPGRPITLIHKPDQPPPAHIGALFDQCAAVGDVSRFPGMTIKLAVYEPAPYAENMFIDADCLLMKPDMDRHWARYGVADFNMAGEIRRTGSLFGCDVARMMAAADAPYMIDANSGVFFFRKNEAGAAAFATARQICDARHPDMMEQRARRGDGLGDQPYFAAAMARAGTTPVSYTPEEGTIMATTYRADRIDFDLAARRATLRKPTGFRIAGRLWARGWVAHDTSIAHFIELRPRRAYQRLSDWLRAKYGVPAFVFE